MDLRLLIPLTYFIAAITFILGLKGLSGPKTAVNGNRIAGAGMLLAVAATFFDIEFQSYGTTGLVVTAAGLLIGGAAGFVGARLVKMTAMPQMIALFNGAGGGAAALVSILELMRGLGHGGPGVTPGETISSMLGLMIGAVSFSGSAVAFGKLQSLITPKAFKYGGQQIVTSVLFGGMILLSLLLAASVAGMITVPQFLVIAAVAILSLLFGVALVMPIGGADMPVVISLLNAFTGLAVAAAGFVLGNQLLIVAGTLVGASGTILTRLMSKAMNRSIANVLFGAFGAAPAAGAATGGAMRADDGRTVRETTAEDAATLLAYARNVIVVPGYGLAVAQAQHNVRELADLLESRGVNVVYAIHPVAGRMPGHMNVLLAEANVPYEKLMDMDAVNPEFPRADVALVIGANDVTNPAARSTKGSPIYGMPILDVDKAQQIIVIKRSMKPGFAGIDNDLYLDPKTQMLFGDAKEAVAKLVAGVKAS
ncbi:MAG: NAD(P)(+) transhydrogenase (Re/Si-specific) subunit beta [Chloroflexota bacterium]|nr:NAD(P)(+) transhydrogenase (Re/Si-specific) subunit beta [Chloroflexota bacterium]